VWHAGCVAVHLTTGIRRPKEHPMRTLAFALAVASLSVATAVVAGPPAGALHTTDVDGRAVNANHYLSKPDVYVSGGPNSNAGPILDAGEYLFMVTDPAGKVLLSQDDVAVRRFTVDGQGHIVSAATHATGTDLDDGDLTVQLFPFADTPNPGGVYKVWITLRRYYRPGQGNFGFIEKYCKTDTFKVEEPGCDCECR
jgi:hypothetical protein